MFGSINDDTTRALDFALHSVQSERNHPLEPTYKDRDLLKAEEGIRTAIRALQAYLGKAGVRAAEDDR